MDMHINNDVFTNMLYVKYPLLKDGLKRSIHDYCNYIIEIYKNYNKDRSNIEKNILNDPGEITDICPFQGDIHNGRSASKIITQKGVLYYKPTNAKTLELFYKVLNLLKSSLSSIDFYQIKYYSTESYMWMGEVKSETCKSIEEVKDYYYRSGVYLFIFYLLSTYDMHYENIISSPQGPIIIDFETISLAPTIPIIEKNNLKEPTNSVLNTAFIPYINDNGAFDINLSGILSHSIISERDEGYYYIANKENGFQLKKGKAYLNVESEITLNNKSIINKYLSLEEIRIILRKGFEDTANIAINLKDKITSIYETLLLNKDILIRQLLRPTQVYHKFVEASKHPDILKSEDKLAELLLILEDNFTPSQHGYIRVQEEIEQIKKHYIPVFHAHSNSKDLYSDNKIICTNYFTETIYNSLLRKLDKLNKEQIDYQLNLIDYSILTLTTQDDFVDTVNLNEIDESEKINQNSIDNCIKELINKINKNVIYYDQDLATVLNPHITKNRIIWRIKESGVNLYEDGGIILLLSYYGFHKKQKQYLDTALKFLNYMNMTRNNTNNFSVFSGLGSLIYLNHNISTLIKDDAEYKKLSKQYKSINDEIISLILDKANSCEFHKQDFDFLNGILSSIYLICKLYLDDKERYADIRTKLGEIKNKVIESFNEDWFNEIGFAHGITGVAVSLSMIYKVTEDTRILHCINTIIEKENKFLLDIGISNIPDTWCRGMTGIILGRELIYKNLCNNTNISRLKNSIMTFNEKYLENILRNSGFNNKNYCLCHGIFGNLEILRKINHNGKYNKILYKKYFNSFKDLKWIKELNVPIDTFMMGNSGIAYVLLELSNKSIPSILSLDLLK